MTSGSWAAILAALALAISAAALSLTWRSTRASVQSAAASAQAAKAAERAASAAEAQTEIQEKIRVAAARPYIWVDVREDDGQGMLLDLVIGNSGPSVATNVRALIDPPLPTHPQLEEAIKAQQQLAEGISVLHPERRLGGTLGQGFT